MIRRALIAFSYVSFVCLGSMVFEISGMAIGALLSLAAVSIVLGAAEIKWARNVDRHREEGLHSERWTPASS